MTSREEAARAIAFFEASDDMALLRSALEETAPRVKRMVGNFLRRGSEDAIPPPAELRAARDAGSREEALAALRDAQDFSLLQAITRTVGQRIETLEIAASADFSVGSRVTVPEQRGYPRRGIEQPGVVEETGTILKVLLDNGETWQGPPSLARLGAQR